MRLVTANRALEALSKFLVLLPPRERLIFEHRLVLLKPARLEELGQRLGLTRERIRQLQKLIEAKWRHPSTAGVDAGCYLRAIARSIRHQVGPVTSSHNLREVLVTAFDIDDSRVDNQIAKMAHQLLHKELGYTDNGTTCLDPTALAVVDDLKSNARILADDVGLIDEHRLQTHLPDESWFTHWDTLVTNCRFHRLNGCLALRDTKKANVKAALLSIGRPATRKEVGERCGIDPARVGSHLSVVKGIVRADKKRWALAEWIDDIYEGIPAEITQRVRDGGGSVHISVLLDELPQKFGVREESVRAYVASPAFRLEHGWVSIADQPELDLGTFDDIIHGYTPDGDPYWLFEMYDRYREGYSIIGVPPELITAIGGSLGCNFTIPVLRPSGCSDVSVIWRTTAFSGPEIGRVASSLIAIDANQHDVIRLVVQRSGVSFAHHDRQKGGPAARRSADLAGGATIEKASMRHSGVAVAEPIRARLATQHKAPHQQGLQSNTLYQLSDTESYEE